MGGKTKPNIKLDHEVEILFELGVYHHLGRNLGSMSSFILLELWHFIFFAILQMSQYCALKESGLLNATFEADIKEIEHLVERKKVVVWADQTSEPAKQNNLPEVSILMTFPQLGPVHSSPCSAWTPVALVKLLASS